MTRHLRGIAAFGLGRSGVVCVHDIGQRSGDPGTPERPECYGRPHPPSRRFRARDLLLQGGASTPLGPATTMPVGATYFTSVTPTECNAALLFKGSPRSADHAESSYQVDGQALYAESIDNYDKKLNPHDVVRKSFGAVSKCHDDAVGHSPQGDFRPMPMHLSLFTITSDRVLVWTMTRSDWTCDYGLVALARTVLLASAYDAESGFPMADWASKRPAQLDSRTT